MTSSGLNESAELFRHVTAEKATFYRCIMDVFAMAKRQYRLQLRPDEVLAEATWPGSPPRIEEVNTALAQLEAWGNLEAHPDTARVSNLSDFYRARFLYRLSQGGEAVESALVLFVQTLRRRAELQTVALEDIASRLKSLRILAADDEPDAAKIHETLRDLVRVFEGLAENAQAFMAGVARSIELQQAEASTVATYKRRLIDYLERFMGDLVRRSETIAGHILALEPSIEALLQHVSAREARDAAPGDAQDRTEAESRYLQVWRERWQGLRGWFFRTSHEASQAELLRARARSAIPQLLGAIAALNERRSGRSDRSADFRVLAGWFAACADDGEAHRLARAAFALNPARHFSLNIDADADLPASTRWANAPPLKIHPRLREYGEAAPRGPLPRVRDRSEARALLVRELAEESLQVEAARRRLATGQSTRLSDLGELDPHAFGLFLGLLGEALTEQGGPERTVERQTGDGLLHIRLEPLASDSHAEIKTLHGIFAGRDHLITITPSSGG
ncbi:TIGR02677 family protein [Hyphomicrobium sp. CS1BSMeth3]|uniref:TIGR02677 family protein n=1 Tax=Hyphomicrobium sp. CS1BSMeth3 TaxID=1892844 RepID=UPI000931942C|nr:TIGR02677 family protein [Hyphomicrobium sp. CS1BSMeth3]